MTEADLSVMNAREASRGNVRPIAAKTSDLKEVDIQGQILRALKTHPAVGWAARFNSGMANMGGRLLRFSTVKGLSDIVGQLIDGRFLAIEVKRPGEIANVEQKAFLETVNNNNGVGFVARSVADVWKVLDEVKRG